MKRVLAVIVSVALAISSGSVAAQESAPGEVAVYRGRARTDARGAVAGAVDHQGIGVVIDFRQLRPADH